MNVFPLPLTPVKLAVAFNGAGKPERERCADFWVFEAASSEGIIRILNTLFLSLVLLFFFYRNIIFRAIPSLFFNNVVIEFMNLNINLEKMVPNVR